MHQVLARKVEHVLLETYRYESGPAGVMEPHAHEEYQVALSFDFPGEYRYRGATLPVPAASVTVLHPGEPHAARDPMPREHDVHYAMLYIDEAFVRQVAGEAARVRGSVVFEPVSIDPGLLGNLTGLYRRLFHEPQRLAQDALTRAFLHELLVRQGHVITNDVADDPRAVRIASEYLRRHATDEVSLERLSFIAGVSAFHLSRLFVRHLGFPPHRYQLQLRVAHAKELLAQGVPIRDVALQAGFSDQSHLNRHFKRYVGVSPGRYLRKS